MSTLIMSPRRRALIGLVMVASASQLSAAQSLENRIGASRGTVGFEFPARRNVCGNGQNITISDDSSTGWMTRTTRSGISIGRRVNGEQYICEQGPVRVIVSRANGKVTDVRVSVGGKTDRAESDLGAVAPADATRYLLAIAPELNGRSADNAIMGAAIADGAIIWRRLIEIARDNGASEASRKASLFWVSQEASAAATAGLDAVAADDDAQTSVRSDALFFLAQRPNGEGIPGLIRVVRESKSVKLRKDAIWHLSAEQRSACDRAV
ncbi:MAG: hypothetical protein ABJE10_00470 [bacterium]